MLLRKAAALQVLRAQCVGETPSTDLAGFVLAAAEILTQQGQAHDELMLVLITDLQDNRGFKVAPGLDGVRVEIQVIGNESNPEKVTQMREKWTKRFTGWGATEVRFLRPAVTAIEEPTSCTM